MSARCLAFRPRAGRAVAAGLAMWVWAGAAAAEAPVSPWSLLGLERPPRGFADVLPVCVPPVNRPEVETAARVARKGDVRQALTLLPPPQTFSESRSERAVALFRSILDARTSLRSGVHAARRALATALEAYDDPRARACGWSERARLGLRTRLAGEALGDLALAARELPSDEPELAERVAYYRAEALWMLGREEPALAAFRALAGAKDPRVVWVARAQVASTDGDVRWSELREHFERGAGLGVDMDVWATYAGELAVRAERLGDALHWLSRGEQSASPGDELAAIRRADALIEGGRESLGLLILERLERRGERRVVREIAALRLARPTRSTHPTRSKRPTDGSASAGELKRREERLLFASRSATPRVAALALVGLARHHLAASQPGRALDAVGRLRTLAPRGGVPELDELTSDAVELAASTSDDCVVVVRRLAGGRAAWMRSIRTPDALLRLGDCARELELRSTAADVYRALSRRFPNRLGSVLALRIAGASWELGERSVVESMLAANARIERTRGASFEQRAPWMRLRAEMARADGRDEEALVLLRLLAESSRTPVPERERVARALIELRVDSAPESAAAADVASALEATLRWDRDLSPEQTGLAWLRLADLRLRSERADAARRAYRKASELLPVGTDAWGRSVHALSATAATREQRKVLLQELARSEEPGAWNDLAQSELRLAHLRHLIDQSERISR